MDNVKEDMEPNKLNVQQTVVLLWDRNQWKHQVAGDGEILNSCSEELHARMTTCASVPYSEQFTMIIKARHNQYSSHNKL